MIEGLLLDLDGTLINQNNEISSRVKNLVIEQAKSIPVSIVSGREASEVKKFADQLQLKGIQFSDNGARIIDGCTGQTIMSVNIQEVLIKNILDKIYMDRLQFLATSDKRTFNSLVEVNTFEISTVVIVLDNLKQALNLELLYSGNFGLRVNISSDSNREKYYLNLNHSHVSKGLAVNYFCREYSLDKTKVMAIGDSYNDLEMLSNVGIGVAMKNAPVEVKEIAKFVVNDVDFNGVEEALARVNK